MNRFHRWYCRSSHWRHTIQSDILPWALQDVDLGDHVLEVGPGPGLATDVLAGRVQQVAALEVDGALAASLRARFSGTNVTVDEGDATAIPYPAGSFTGAVCFTMLHHVPSAALQDRLLAEVRRVLRPGATFAGSDSRTSLMFRLAHISDTMVVVDPDAFADRLATAGFEQVRVDTDRHAFRFRARVPDTSSA